MNRICIIGGANIDICGASLKPLRNYDSNPGTIGVSFGGVGRNIAQVCALLSKNVWFVTCFSDDAYGKMMREDCEKLGMNTSLSTVTGEYPTSMYMAVLDENHDMHIGMSDMRILDTMDEKMLSRVMAELHPDDIIIMDANLAPECIDYILHHAPCMIAADPVSTAKAVKLKDSLDHIAIFKPNQFESKELTGITIKDEETAAQSLEWFREHGVKEVLISLADKGILLGTETGMSWFTHRTIRLENATGGGDSLLGAYVSRRVLKESPQDALRFAISTAVTVIEDDAVKRRSLNSQTILDRIADMEIKEKKL